MNAAGIAAAGGHDEQEDQRGRPSAGRIVQDADEQRPVAPTT